LVKDKLIPPSPEEEEDDDDDNDEFQGYRAVECTIAEGLFQRMQLVES